MNSVNWTRKAVKQLMRVQPQHQLQIREAVGSLANMPDVTNVTPLNQHDSAYRLRVGRYRVLFDWESSIKIISIQEVKKRDERTY